MTPKKFHVLLVEDDENGQLLVRLAFEQSQLRHSLRAVNDGEEAMAYLRGEGRFADRQC